MVKFSSHKSKKKQPVETEKEEDDKSEQIFLSLDTEKLEIDEVCCIYISYKPSYLVKIYITILFFKKIRNKV